jgi:hypothetical protein
MRRIEWNEQMNISATNDVPDAVRAALTRDLASVWSTADRGAIHLKAAEPPTYLEIVGRAIEWATPLKVVATVFVSQLAKDAAHDVWINKARIASVLKNGAVASLRIAAQAIIRARLEAPRKPEVHLGVGELRGDMGAFVVFTPADEMECAAVLARVALHAERVEAAIDAEVHGGGGILGPAQLILEPAGLFRLRWIDYEGKSHERVLG